MRTLRTAARGAAAAMALAAASGCENDLPTISGVDRFPEGSLPVTVEVVLDAEQFLTTDTVFADYTEARSAPFLLVARQFDGALDAHTLARFTGFPDSVSSGSGTTSQLDTVFTYGAGRVVSVVNVAASASPEPARLRLWALDQAWDSAAVTWTVAESRGGAPVPWRVPGGTRGRLLSETLWTPADTATNDSIVFSLDSLAVAAIAAEGFPGVLVTSETPGSRIQLSQLLLNTGIRTASRPDTLLARTFVGPQEFVFTPAPPRVEGVLRVGGITGERTVLRLDLNQRVPACARPATTPSCPQVALRDVTLNRAGLVLQAVPVPSGFRPLSVTDLRVRRVVETELGRRAPLAESFALDTIPAAPFAAGAGGPVVIDLTTALTQVAASDSAAATIALLAEPEGGQFGLLWFAGRPQLRLVYTLPLRPRLP